jgi:hypothetical protein
LSKHRGSRSLPTLTDLIAALENVNDVKGALHLNLFIIFLAGYAINMWLGGLIDSETLREYFSKLRETLISGSYDIDREIMEIVSTLGSDLINEATYDEIINKAVMILRDLA